VRDADAGQRHQAVERGDGALALRPPDVDARERRVRRPVDADQRQLARDGVAGLGVAHVE